MSADLKQSVKSINVEEIMDINPNNRYRINAPKVVHEIIDNEVVIIHFDTGNYYSLKDVGLNIWTLVESGATFNQVIERVSRMYVEVDDEIEGTISQFINELICEGLIENVDVSHTPGEQKVDLQVELTRAGALQEFKTPVLQKYSDMQELLLLDPIHEVDEAGWPSKVLDPRTD